MLGKEACILTSEHSCQSSQSQTGCLVLEHVKRGKFRFGVGKRIALQLTPAVGRKTGARVMDPILLVSLTFQPRDLVLRQRAECRLCMICTMHAFWRSSLGSIIPCAPPHPANKLRNRQRPPDTPTLFFPGTIVSSYDPAGRKYTFAVSTNTIATQRSHRT